MIIPEMLESATSPDYYLSIFEAVKEIEKEEV